MTDTLLEVLMSDLARDEADRLTVYDDATGQPIKPGTVVIGVPTIARGVNLVEGITPEESAYLSMNRLRSACGDLDRNAGWWRELTPHRQRALLNMCFNLGWPRLATFKNMLSALHLAVGLEESGAFDIANEKYVEAAAEALDSKWAKQVGDRAIRIAKLIEEG